MADLVKAATPINNRNVVTAVKEHRDPSAAPFDFQDLSKVKQTAGRGEAQAQSNTVREDGSSNALYQAVKTPDSSVTFIRSIMMMRQISNILMLNNDPQTEEINQLLDKLSVTPEQIAAEMKNQENTATLFKGGLFDTLRGALAQAKSPELDSAAAVFLKILYQDAAKSDVAGGTKNNLIYLKSVFNSSAPLLEKLDGLIKEFDAFLAQSAEKGGDALAMTKALQTAAQGLSEAASGELKSAAQELLAAMKSANALPAGTADATQALIKSLAGQKAAANALTKALRGADGMITDELKNALRNVQGAQKGAASALLRTLAETDQRLSGGAADTARTLDTALRAVRSAGAQLPQSLERAADAFAKALAGAQQAARTSGGQDFSALKAKTLALFGEMEKSVLYSADAAKTISLATYNLSRYSDAAGQTDDAFLNFIKTVTEQKLRDQFTAEFEQYRAQPDPAGTQSQTLKALAEIIYKQSVNENVRLLSSDSMDKIIYSMLSSPSNFTPLLHYVIPAEYEDTQACAEMWINPDAEEELPADERKGKGASHMLFLFDVDGVGKFEAELFVTGKNIDLKIFCPPEATDFYQNLSADIRQATASSDYRFTEIQIAARTEERSLIDVFKTLPLRRAGINVTI
ncbi:MAG: hypothetical protein QM689_07740 [Oscillospiraceae bacterium]